MKTLIITLSLLTTSLASAVSSNQDLFDAIASVSGARPLNGSRVLTAIENLECQVTKEPASISCRFMNTQGDGETVSGKAAQTLFLTIANASNRLFLIAGQNETHTWFQTKRIQCFANKAYSDTGELLETPHFECSAEIILKDVK